MPIHAESPILYFGAPVALINPLSEDESGDRAPMSPGFRRGWRRLLGLASIPERMYRCSDRDWGRERSDANED